MSLKKGKPPRSAIRICQLLSTEGFSDYAANQIDAYWQHASGLTDRQLRQIKSMDKEFGELVRDKNFSEAEKQLLGRFIGLHKKMSFDAGLRIGLAVSSVRLVRDENLPPYAHNPPTQEHGL